MTTISLLSIQILTTHHTWPHVVQTRSIQTNRPLAVTHDKHNTTRMLLTTPICIMHATQAQPAAVSGGGRRAVKAIRATMLARWSWRPVAYNSEWTAGKRLRLQLLVEWPVGIAKLIAFMTTLYPERSLAIHVNWAQMSYVIPVRLMAS